MELVWIKTVDVRKGDKIACLLSDAQAFLTVTGWCDRTIDLTKYGLGKTTYRHFDTSGCPWWAEDMRSFQVSDAGETLIVSRQSA